MGQPVIVQLVELSKVDAVLARLMAERKQIEKELEARAVELKTHDSLWQAKTKESNDLRLRLKREEGFLKSEQEKLTTRRRNLSQLGNYKHQQAAEREIEAAARQLELQEEALLKVMEQAEGLDKQVTELKAKVEALHSEVAKLSSDAGVRIKGIDERRAEKGEQRSELAKQVDVTVLKRYEAISHRLPMDPVVAIKDKRCAACSMQLGPQIAVKVAKGDGLVQCPGCSRILFIESAPAGA